MRNLYLDAGKGFCYTMHVPTELCLEESLFISLYLCMYVCVCVYVRVCVCVNACTHFQFAIKEPAADANMPVTSV